MSLSELAQKVDITMANLSILKNNKARAIRFSTLEAICAALDCQPGHSGVCAGRRGVMRTSKLTMYSVWRKAGTILRLDFKLKAVSRTAGRCFFAGIMGYFQPQNGTTDSYILRWKECGHESTDLERHLRHG